MGFLGFICNLGYGNLLGTAARVLRNQFLKIRMGLCCSKPRNDGDDSDHHVEFAGGNVHLITTKQSWDEKLSEASRDGKIVVANFSASWCGPCRVIATFYSELSEKYPVLMFLTVDVDELTDDFVALAKLVGNKFCCFLVQEFSTTWDIKATPTFFFLRDGQQVEKLVGANKPELQKKVIAIVNSVATSQK
ncbi:hypothetical protein HYC85_006278 [Camellia sinensis]|uniref:Thioredoxin domain-containing protein n=1 Tax=Camellia sinensis TaxID=4442 RepID=A0A7J7HKJ2_CAMSI|nr:hypothetical protein HYC85_006278 [Camellia sinensis]